MRSDVLSGSKPISVMVNGNHNNIYLPHGVVLKVGEDMFVKK